MRRVSIVTDSAAGLDQETIDRLGIKVLPLTVHLAGERYQEGIDITSEQFLERLSQAGVYPRLSAPSVESVGRVYEELASTGVDILSLHVSGTLDRTLDAARRAAMPFLGRTKIEVMDYETISLAEGIIARAAGEAAAAGDSLDDIVRLVRGMTPHVYSIFFVESLNYLEHGGRIGIAQAILGSMLQVKPLLTIEEGDIFPMEKVRTQDKAIEKLVEFVSEFSHIEDLAILQHRFTEATASLIERLDMLFPGRQVPIYTYNPSLAVHIGPAALGAVIYEGQF